MKSVYYGFYTLIMMAEAQRDLTQITEPLYQSFRTSRAMRDKMSTFPGRDCTLRLVRPKAFEIWFKHLCQNRTVEKVKVVTKSAETVHYGS